MKIRYYGLNNFRDIPQLKNLRPSALFEMEVVANVLPFKVNSYVLDELIDWANIPSDPMYLLSFPQREMLPPADFDRMAKAIEEGYSETEKNRVRSEIRKSLNPHPAGQLEYNVPTLKNGTRLMGVQHKYEDTCLFFPSQGQTCHNYCTFCFRWPQFVGMDVAKFAMKEGDNLVAYLREHPEITDLLITGGDPMVMKSSILSVYIEKIIEANLPSLSTIRIGTKSLTYFPHRFLEKHDPDASPMLEIFRRIRRAGFNLSVMAHFDHPREIDSETTREAIEAIRDAGAVIRTQCPLLANINDDSAILRELWNKQVKYGCIPYYLFVVRDTGARSFYQVPLSKAYHIFRDAYQGIGGLARTIRGPCMSVTHGKVLVEGLIRIGEERYFLLKFLRNRDRRNEMRHFLAKMDEKAIWYDDLEILWDDLKPQSQNQVVAV